MYRNRRRVQTRDVKGKAKFGDVHRSVSEEKSRRAGQEEERTMISATAGTSASAVAAAPLLSERSKRRVLLHGPICPIPMP